MSPRGTETPSCPGQTMFLIYLFFATLECGGSATHHHRLRQSVLDANGAERPAEQAAARRAGEGQLVQVRGGASPEGPGDEGTPPFKRLLTPL